MRPPLLFPLFSDVSQLKGIGSHTRSCIKRLCGNNRVIDIVFHLPCDIIDRRRMPAIPEAENGTINSFIVTIGQHFPAPHTRGGPKKTPYKVKCSNATGTLYINFFNTKSNFIKEQLPERSKRVISGRVEHYNNTIQIVHPDYIVPLEQLPQIQKVEAVYPLTTGLSAKYLNKAIHQAILSYVPNLPEWHSSALLKTYNWPSWYDALQKLHHPEKLSDLAPFTLAHKRLAYDELLANQLALQLARKHVTSHNGRIIKSNQSLTHKLHTILPFELTANQQQVIEEIHQDQSSTNRMLRLLQGDVGSGKTAVALFTILHAIENGHQTALMAPTEILARQHMAWIGNLCEQLGIRYKLLINKIKQSEKNKIYQEAADGEIDILIGTHSLFQDKLTFKDLAYIVIDEQHRFGVEQRMKLAKKGHKADILLMTATPIPRTLTMTAFGDMTVSRLTKKPKNRQPIATKTVPLSRINEVVEGLKRALIKGEKAYWICPLVEESEKIDLAAAEERFRELKYIFKDRVGLVHGQMKTDERDTTMHQFRDSDLDILIATTVVEVGVDVSDATIIIIEHAERFGLAQLHQLRGRVGRGSKPSHCILLYNNQLPLSPTSKARLAMMKQTNDGFLIAEEDLKLRGSGDLMGTKQSGLPSFKVANLEHHQDLLFNANKDAKLTLEQDPNLESERGKHLKNLLYLFEYDMHIKYLQES